MSFCADKDSSRTTESEETVSFGLYQAPDDKFAKEILELTELDATLLDDDNKLPPGSSETGYNGDETIGTYEECTIATVRAVLLTADLEAQQRREEQHQRQQGAASPTQVEDLRGQCQENQCAEYLEMELRRRRRKRILVCMWLLLAVGAAVFIGAAVWVKGGVGRVEAKKSQATFPTPPTGMPESTITTAAPTIIFIPPPSDMSSSFPSATPTFSTSAPTIA